MLHGSRATRVVVTDLHTNHGTGSVVPDIS